MRCDTIYYALQNVDLVARILHHESWTVDLRQRAITNHHLKYQAVSCRQATILPRRKDHPQMLMSPRMSQLFLRIIQVRRCVRVPLLEQFLCLTVSVWWCIVGTVDTNLERVGKLSERPARSLNESVVIVEREEHLSPQDSEALRRRKVAIPSVSPETRQRKNRRRVIMESVELTPLGQSEKKRFKRMATDGVSG